MAADSAPRVDLYGASFVLPPGWEDWSEYAFLPRQGPLRKLTFTREAVKDAELEAFLAHGRDQVSQLRGAHVKPMHTFPNPHFRARGFSAEFEGQGTFSCVGLAGGGFALILRTKGSHGDALLLEQLVHSIKPASEKATAPLHRVYDVEFRAPVPLDEPREFVFVAQDQKSRLTAQWHAAQPEWRDVEWSTFTVPPDAALTTSPREQRSSHATAAAGALAIELAIDRAVATTPALPDAAAQRTELFCAQARSQVPRGFLFLEFRCELGLVAADKTFGSIIASMRRES